MERQHFLDSLRRDSAGMIAAARSADAATPVPCCPDWTMADLMWHIGKVHDFWSYVVRQQSLAPDGYDDPLRPDDFAAIVAVAERRADALHLVLSEADSSGPAWNWTGQLQTAGWVTRRMAQETAVHRVDAERVGGGDHRIDVDLATNGIDEYLTYFLPAGRGRGVEGAVAPLTGSVHLHCTDGAGEWTVTPGDDGSLAVTRDHAKADAALRGDANDLLLTLWRRLPLDAVTVFGDTELAAAFVADTTNE